MTKAALSKNILKSGRGKESKDYPSGNISNGGGAAGGGDKAIGVGMVNMMQKDMMPAGNTLLFNNHIGGGVQTRAGVIDMNKYLKQYDFQETKEIKYPTKAIE